MFRRAASVFILVALTAFATVGLTSPAGVHASPDALVVHEWGTFTTVAGEVHNVKNASSSAPATALAFYVAKKGARLEDLSVPAK